MKMKSLFKRITAALFAVALLLSTVACTSEPPADGDKGNVDLNQKESPSVTALVEKGELPALEQRLPEEPLVLKTEEYGAYGGTMRQTVTNAMRGHAFAIMGLYQRNLVVWNEDHTEIVPNLAKTVTLSEDAMKLTVTLRKGLKWSDGHPMTTEDVQFWWDAYANNKTLSPGNTTWDGKELKVIDEVTFEMTFDEPEPLILSRMADGSTGSYWYFPKHYLEKYHLDYNPNAEAEAEKLMFTSWINCFLDRLEMMNNPDLPVMTPWRLNTSGTAASQLELVRNPYYWATDDKGRQLPYIDSCLINLVQSDELVAMKLVSGEFDIAYANVMENMADYSLYARNKESGGYDIFTAEFEEPNAMNIHLNTTSLDTVKRAYFQNKDFRVALSYAINRQNIVDVRYTVGTYKSEVRQFAPIPESDYYSEKMATQYTEFDQAKANQMLDALGLTQRDENGMRLMSDGRVLSIVIDVPTYSSLWMDVANMIASDWQAVGINASTKSVDPSLWETRCIGNNFDCTVFTGGGGFEVLSELTVNDYTGYEFFAWPQRYFAGAYAWKNSDGQGGVEPMECVKQLWEVGQKLVNEPDPDEQKKLVDEILKIHEDNFLILGICTRLPAMYLINNRMHNIPANLSPSWTYGATGYARPDQYWIG